MCDFDKSIYQNLSSVLSLCVLFSFIPITVFGAGVEFGNIQTGSVPDYNIKIGEAYFDSTIRSGIGWDSNYDRDAEAKGSVFYSVGFLTDVSWVPTPSMTLTTNLDLQYIEKPEDERGGRFLISGGVDQAAASMSVAIRSGDRVVTLNSKVSSSLAGLRIEDGAGKQRDRSFEQLAYTVGANYTRALSPNLTSNFGYTFSSQQAIGNQTEDELASQLNSNSHNITTRLALNANQSLRTGLFAATTLTERADDAGHQLQTYQVGVEGTYLSSYAVVFGLSLGASYQGNSERFSNSGSAWSPEVQFSANFMGRSLLEHKFTLSYQRDFSNLVADTGVINPDLAQYSQTISLGYALNLELTPTWEVSARQGLRQVDDVRSSARSRRYYFNFRTGYVIAPRWTVNFNYDYTNQFDGGAKGEGYSQHIVSTSLSFKL